MINEKTHSPRTIIRIGRQTLSFAAPQPDGRSIKLEPYVVKSGMSMAANLREAFRESELLALPNRRVQVVTDTDVMLIPLDEYEEETAPELFYHTFPRRKKELVMTHVMPGLNCVVVFSINKDLHLVITDHFEDVRVMPIQVPVWSHLHQLSYAGRTQKLYAYAHEGRLTVFSFSKNRFRFVNTFAASEVTDAAYFILYVWQQLTYDSHKDEIFLVGDYEAADKLRTELKRYVANVYPISPSAEFNRAPVTQLPNITYDLICLCES